MLKVKSNQALKKLISAIEAANLELQKSKRMKKFLLILGSSEVELLHKAYQIGGKCQHHELVRVQAQEQNIFQFGPCDVNTKILIVHDVKSVDGLFEFYHTINGMEINERGKEPVTIHPQIIITSTVIKLDQLPQDASFTNRFDVLDLDHVKHF